jgi:hypothetical protein
VQRGDGSWLVDGLMNVDELGELLGLRGLPDGGEGDYQTVGGMVMSHLGRVPAAGDRFDWREFSFEVVDMDGHRVDKVLVTRAPLRPTTCRRAIAKASPLWPRRMKGLPYPSSPAVRRDRCSPPRYLFSSPRNAISSFAAAAPARFAPMVDAEGPYPTRWTLGSLATCVANLPVMVMPPLGSRSISGAR